MLLKLRETFNYTTNNYRETGRLITSSNLQGCCRYDHAHKAFLITINLNPPASWRVKQIKDVLLVSDSICGHKNTVVWPLCNTRYEVTLLGKRSHKSPDVVLTIILHHMLFTEDVQVPRRRSRPQTFPYIVVEAAPYKFPRSRTRSENLYNICLESAST